MLYFETYIIIALLFTILTFLIAGSYLKNKKYTIVFSVFILILGFVIPYVLILLQRVYGSLGEIHSLSFDSLMWREGKTVEESMHVFITEPTAVEMAGRYFIHNIGFIILSIAIGIAIGILVHSLSKKQKAA